MSYEIDDSLIRDSSFENRALQVGSNVNAVGILFGDIQNRTLDKWALLRQIEVSFNNLRVNARR